MAQLSDEDRENLVAYLDGELDDATAQALESRLNLDPVARAEADALKRTWELLDYLPRPEPSSDFTHRTMERLSGQRPLAPKQPAGARRPRRWLAPLGWAAAVGAAVWLGNGAAEHLWTGRSGGGAEDAAEVDEFLARHLDLIKNKQQYEAAEDLEFLRGLDHPDLFGDDSES